MNKHFSIYIHVPFCVSKCFYCDFTSYAGKDELIPAYFNALTYETKIFAELYRKKKVDSIFIGGGTPSYVHESYIGDVLDTIASEYSLSDKCEITIETNPGTLTNEKCKAYKNYGINRVSMGMQAAQDRMLQMLGRAHSFQDVLRSIEAIRNAGFDNLNLDIMFGLPTQTLSDWHETIDKAISLFPEHISAYSLIIEEGTPFYASYADYAEDEKDREMYHVLLDALSSKKYIQYEISNFALSGKQCRHNLYCWDMEEYLGFGANAHSFIGCKRFANEADLENYIKSINQKGNAKVVEEFLDTRELMGDYIMLALRKTSGIDLTDFKDSFNVDIMSVYHNETDNFIRKGLLELKTDYLRLTKTGLDYANYVMRAFL